MAKKKAQPAYRKYSIIALIAALLACISTALLGAVKGVIALDLYTIQSPEKLTNALWISLGVMSLGLALYAAFEPAKIQRFLTGRQAKHGGNALVTTLAFILTLVVVNLLVFDNPYQIADLTENQANTLSPELTAALKTLPEKVTAVAFFSQEMNPASADQLLGNIKAASDGKFEYEFADPNRDPQRARKANITGDGKILLQMGERSEIVSFASEEEILKALIRLISPEEHTVYFLTGHGELDSGQINQDGNSALTRASETLTSKNYTVKTLNLLAENKIPEDANLIIIAGPQTPLSTNEVGLLRAYLNNGGALLVMEDPTFLTKVGNAPDPLADMLAEDWGVTLNNDIVIDLASPNPSVGFSASYDPTHPITNRMNNLATFFPFTRSVTVDLAKQGLQLSPLVLTANNSWGERDFNSLTQAGGPASYDQTSETLGPLTLAVAIENPTTHGRVVAFGTSQFPNDENFDSGYGNSDLFINSVDWAAEQENIVGITPKEPITRMFRPASQLRILLLMFVAAIVIPGAFAVMGFYTWLQRKRQG